VLDDALVIPARDENVHGFWGYELGSIRMADASLDSLRERRW